MEINIVVVFNNRAYLHSLKKPHIVIQNALSHLQPIKIPRIKPDNILIINPLANNQRRKAIIHEGNNKTYFKQLEKREM